MMRGSEVRAFWGACNEEAKKIAADLRSKDPDAVANAEIELSIHKGIVAGEIEPEEGKEGKSEKILELLAAYACSLI
ncbi:hypothetical protein CYMTET_16767 [Cymbomonas tetramitiformis]|uniref:Uncharacterized protein n=1 Tax=Cymbomonas tetramitiformis TaxID=36881 RepID=A0AAE0GBX8_9CHLO|nr:hypothetical protein CYMTET_16767 [Cymbomonas tetramitiformis]